MATEAGWQYFKGLLTHQKGADHTFLPCGHIGLGEKAQAALLREIAEEIGQKAIVKQFIGAVKRNWMADDQDNHEINLIFEVHIPNLDPSKPTQSNESQLEFMWVEPAELKGQNLQPDPLIECLVNQKRGYHGFWESSIIKNGS